MIRLIASDDRGQTLFADTGITDDHDPPWFSARASWRAFVRTYASLNKSIRVAAIANFVFFTKIRCRSHFSPEIAGRSSRKSSISRWCGIGFQTKSRHAVKRDG
jgi:hypothetical protein